MLRELGTSAHRGTGRQGKNSLLAPGSAKERQPGGIPKTHTHAHTTAPHAHTHTHIHTPNMVTPHTHSHTHSTCSHTEIYAHTYAYTHEPEGGTSRSC